MEPSSITVIHRLKGDCPESICNICCFWGTNRAAIISGTSIIMFYIALTHAAEFTCCQFSNATAQSYMWASLMMLYIVTRNIITVFQCQKLTIDYCYLNFVQINNSCFHRRFRVDVDLQLFLVNIQSVCSDITHRQGPLFLEPTILNSTVILNIPHLPSKCHITATVQIQNVSNSSNTISFG